MLGELQRKKLERKFHVFDADSDGFVKRADFDIIIENLLKLRGLTAESDAGRSVADQYIDYWMTLQRFADANQDNQVSLDEWMDYHDAALEFEKVLEEEGEDLGEGPGERWLASRHGSI